MQWENLTSTELGEAARQNRVCVLATGVLERHSEHLPLGTDYLNAHKIACLAAERVPAVVFPPFYFGQIYEARAFPGAVALRPALLLELYGAVLDEIARNGFRKIVILNGHGGNVHLLPFLAQSSLYEEKPYRLYLFDDRLECERQQAWEDILSTREHGHACECETSISLANHPGLVHMERVPAEPAHPLGRMRQLKGNYSGIWWYADFPEHYAGDARTASAEKGLALRTLLVEAFAEYLQRVQVDESVAALEGEFFARERGLRT